MNNNIKFAYILPNLFTAASIFLGIQAVILSVAHDFEKAGWFIVLSLIFDGLDGRVARMTGTTSKFGAEFDSLADVVAFGVAPAMLFYFAFGYELGKLGALVCTLYVIFGSVRLARFNVQSSITEPNVFIGVPIPTAAVFVSTMTLVGLEYELKNDAYILLGLVGIVSLLMVSNIRYPSFKKIDFKKGQFIRMLIVSVVLLSALWLYPLVVLFSLTLAYMIYGIIRALFIRYTKRNILKD